MVTRTGPSKSFSAAHSFTLHSGGIATSKEKAREKPRSPLSLSVSGVKSRLGFLNKSRHPQEDLSHLDSRLRALQ